LPEGVYALVEATLYLATAPKSNTANAYFKAYEKVEAEGKV
jgi:putative ATPase